MNNMFHGLIIEDNESTLNTIQNALSRLGWRASSASSAEAGIEELKQKHYDAVFTALCVREQGGRSIARWIKTQELPVKVFIITSWKGELEPHLLQIDGIHDIIHKPLIFTEIRDKVLEHFG